MSKQDEYARMFASIFESSIQTARSPGNNFIIAYLPETGVALAGVIMAASYTNLLGIIATSSVLLYRGYLRHREVTKDSILATWVLTENDLGKLTEALVLKCLPMRNADIETNEAPEQGVLDHFKTAEIAVKLLRKPTLAEQYALVDVRNILAHMELAEFQDLINDLGCEKRVEQIINGAFGLKQQGESPINSIPTERVSTTNNEQASTLSNVIENELPKVDTASIEKTSDTQTMEAINELSKVDTASIEKASGTQTAASTQAAASTGSSSTAVSGSSMILNSLGLGSWPFPKKTGEKTASPTIKPQ